MAPLFFYFILFPIINSLLIDGDKIKDLPSEYDEYKRQLGYPTSSNPDILKEHAENLREAARASARIIVRYGRRVQNSSHNSSKLNDQPILNAPLLASLQLCKDAPHSDDFIATAYCWIVFVVSLLLIVNLIIYQVRSVFKLKKELPKRKKDGHKSDQQNFECQYPDETCV
jgi:heme exporter protein D